MGSEWIKVAASDFCESVRDGTHNSPKRVEKGQFLVTSRHITDNRLNLDDAYKISEIDFEQINKRSKVDKWDVLITMIGTVGEPCLVKEEPNFAIKNIGLFKTADEINGKWLYYYLLSPNAQYLIKTFSRGSTQQYIPLGALREFPVILPNNKEEMKAIIHILGSLDDKIELNRKMNETLEGIARAIFKSWFIDFDPVRAKVEGRDTGLPDEIADLFPDSFQDSELGEIPEGWGVIKFENLIEQKREKLGKKKAVVLSAVAEGELVKSDEYFNKRVYSKNIDKYIAVKQWDFAFNPSRINIGSIGMLKDPIIGAVSPVYVVFRPEKLYRWFMEFSLKQQQIISWINTLASGSVRQSLSYSDFASIPSILPPESIIDRFNFLYNSFRGGIIEISEETKTLISLRDTLLPKLLSGEYPIDDAKKFIEGFEL